MSSWKKYFKPVNSVLPSQTRSGGNAGYASVDKFNTWLPEVYMGPANRLQRYIQYEQMDMDQEVHAALDTIAEFSTMADEKTGLPFEIRYTDEPSPTEAKLLETTLKQWCHLNEFNKRIFSTFRQTLMYGDTIFVRDPETYKLYWIDPSTVEKVVVNESDGKKPEVYYIRDLDLNMQTLVGSNMAGNRNSGYNTTDTVFPQAQLGQTSGANNTFNDIGSGMDTNNITPVDANHIVHLSMTDGMDNAWPFGISVLESIFKVYKQKELLEDSILIYRVHRAPERRVFFIDVGTMPPNKAQQYLERIKLEVQQKRIPSRTGGGQNITDSSYNPMSMLEDYYFAQTSDGRGSKVETLPGGDNLGEIDDLRYFNNKMFRGLGVPSSYLPTGPDDGTATMNDGRVGTAFVQEHRFSKTCERHQMKVIENLDLEFKVFLKNRGVNIDNALFGLSFTTPQNFSEYRDIEKDTAQLSVYAQAAEIPFLSKRYALKRYLKWTEDEILENERMWKEENGEPSEPTEDEQMGMGAAGISGADLAPEELEGYDTENDMEMDDIDMDVDGDLSDDDLGSFGN